MTKIEIDLGDLTNSCFVIMPFVPTYETEYERIIKPAVEANNLACIRADEIYSKPRITEDIWKALRVARVVIAELTGKNSNVLYEVGLAHALGKPVIIITRNEDDVPFDLKALRYRYYSTDDPFWGDNLKKAIADMIKNLLDEKDYGTVFEKIVYKGEIEYKEREVVSSKTTPIHTPSTNLSGIWKGTMMINEMTYNCVFPIIQTGEKITGTMEISYVIQNTPTIVQEVMAGEIIGDIVNLYGTSYSFVKQGKTTSYNLDSYSSQISSEGNELSGIIRDTRGIEGTFTFKKEVIAKKKGQK